MQAMRFNALQVIGHISSEYTGDHCFIALTAPNVFYAILILLFNPGLNVLQGFWL
jgi:hypothetical protein